ncbi:hypothetical protein [Pseudovibrio exalbescens]|uniref:Uncharacterized protein n=1 Tax=Pseudovibrio exalbescens TaxID=197461 RepID=A0A1U7JCK5_9HYPH|nr:hypothetical protein [Pseudovibrio exalbescens]OKL42371.1 hypothetical protein A3843_00230 [Pseudovibrio exalbescens]
MKAPSLNRRLAAAKAVGLVVGLVIFFITPLVWPDADMMLRIGMLLWYVTLGGIIGLAGVLDRHPALGIALPWWLLAPLLGGWMNLVIVLFTYDRFKALTLSNFGDVGIYASPFWFVPEGVLFGLVAGGVAHLAGGSGRKP